MPGLDLDLYHTLRSSRRGRKVESALVLLSGVYLLTDRRSCSTSEPGVDASCRRYEHYCLGEHRGVDSGDSFITADSEVVDVMHHDA